MKSGNEVITVITSLITFAKGLSGNVWASISLLSLRSCGVGCVGGLAVTTDHLQALSYRQFHAVIVLYLVVSLPGTFSVFTCMFPSLL